MPCALLVATVGCGASNRAAVAGRVSLDGKPVDGGMISFIPTDRSLGSAAWAEIKAGHYSIPAKTGPVLGTNRVEIRWTRKTGRIVAATPPSPATEEVIEAVPTRYNSTSELKVEIKVDKNDVYLELKSK
jgi:hypothetical protein